MIIDLHGMREDEAMGIILTAIMDIQNNEGMTIEIITGNGQVLKGLVMDLVSEEGLSYEYIGNNYGSLLIS